MNRKAIVIAGILTSVAVVLVALNFQELYIDYIRLTNPNSINIIFLTKTGKILSNVSVSLFAFYPTSNGTVVKRILVANDTGLVKLPLSDLTDYARHWIKHYGDGVVPSILGFASYPVMEGNEVVFYVQPFTVSVSPYNVTHGIGKTVVKVFVDPYEIVVHRPSSNVTPPPGTPFLVFSVKDVWFYPSNKALGEIPLSLVYVTDPDYRDYTGVIMFQGGSGFVEVDGSLRIPETEFGFGATVLGYHPVVAGVSIFTTANNVRLYDHVFFGLSWMADRNFAGVYTVGQAAVVNYSIYYYCPSITGPLLEGYQSEVFITGLEVTGSDSSYLPTFRNMSSLNFNPSSFFSNGLTLLFTLSGNMSSNVNLVEGVPTLEGVTAYTIPVKLLVSLAQAQGVRVPSWVCSPLPNDTAYEGIILFLNSSVQGDSYFLSVLDFTSWSNNTYYVYAINTSVPYCIDGQKFYIPNLYYYINYTTS